MTIYTVTPRCWNIDNILIEADQSNVAL